MRLVYSAQVNQAHHLKKPEHCNISRVKRLALQIFKCIEHLT